MKIMKRIQTILIAAALLCCAMILGACGEGGDKNYKVAVKDAFGTPYTDGVVVLFLQGGEQKAMQVVNKETGVAEKTLPAGDYDVKLKFTNADAEFYYDEDAYKLSAKQTEIDVILHQALAGEPEDLFVGENTYDMYAVSTGTTYVELEGGKNYFLFTPKEAGIYEVSIKDAEGVSIGYYGTPFYVHEKTIAELKDNKFTVSIRKSMIGTGETGTAVILIGIDSADAGSGILGVERISDPEYNIEEDEPWTVYKPTAELKPFTLPAGAELVEFDLTVPSDTYKLVYNEEDGFYHMNTADGPLVYVWLTENPPYIDCFQTMVSNVAMTSYFFDENGKFIKKEIYDECLKAYFECVDDEEGVYPLTEDLKYIIQERGKSSGWYDAKDPGYIFLDRNGEPIPGINPEISWLFMCCYAK